MLAKSAAAAMKGDKLAAKLETFIDKVMPDDLNFTLAHVRELCAGLGQKNPLILRHRFKVVEVIKLNY